MPETTPTNRMLTFVAATATTVLLLVPFVPASADDAKLEVQQTAWFWSSNTAFTFCAKDDVLGACQAFVLSDAGPRGIAPVPPGTVSPITYGHLGVSLINGSSDMRSYVKFDASQIPEGAKIGSFRMRLTLSEFTPEHLQYHLEAEGRPPSTFNKSFARINACPVVEPWGPAEGDSPYAFSFQRPEIEKQSTDINRREQRNEPFYDCGQGSARGELTKDGTAFEFDLTRIAQGWADDPLSNEGVALVGAPEGVLSTWLVEFHGAEYTLAPTTPGLPIPVPVPLPDLSGELEDNHYVSAEEAAVATVSFSQPEPTDAPETPTPGPTTTQTIIQPGTTQTIIQPGDPPSTTVIVAQPGVPTPTVPIGDIKTPAWVFLAFPLGLLGVGAMLGAVGKDELAAGAVPIAGSRVATMLRARRLDG